MSEAYEDLAFKAGDQWPVWAKQQRETQKRPILTINRVQQFVHQVTGDLDSSLIRLLALPAGANQWNGAMLANHRASFQAALRPAAKSFTASGASPAAQATQWAASGFSAPPNRSSMAAQVPR